ncbi:MAG TPA: hypothetical protein VFR25_00340 [Candidatus Eisenbacteria bacterium]|nr:hypothetical protein [Candidatus Eisenbacteria bacterium]
MRRALGGVVLAAIGLSFAASALAQPPSTEPPTHGRVTSHLQRTEDERDRFELGMAVPQGYFDWLGTFGYRRFMREGGPLEQSLAAELSGTAKDYLGEGALSVYYLFRPIKSYKEGWKLRPLIEAGPGVHVVVQIADIEGFNDSAFHTQAYLKTHLYGGFEFLFSQKLGLVVRGRVTLPEDHPFDYAQAAILLR